MQQLSVDVTGIEERVETGLLPDRDPDSLCGCGQCDGYGHVYAEGQGMRLCRSQRERTIAGLLSNRYEDWPPPSFTEMRKRPGFKETASFAAAEQMARDLINGTAPSARIFCGGHGRSKTLSALMVLRICAWKGIPFAECKFPELIAAYKKGIDGAPFIESLYKRIGDPLTRLVLVDEVGNEILSGNKEHSRYALSEIVARCYKKKYLILTSNLSGIGLKKFMPSDVVSRLDPGSRYCDVCEEPYEKDLRLQQGRWV